MNMFRFADQTEAIVLAGGLGTRLQKVVSDVPKPMAPMDASGTPFLAYLLKNLSCQGITRVVLSIGYLGHLIQQYFGNNFAGMDIRYVIESSPMGTGGAIKSALSVCESPDVFVLNGDTFFSVDLAELMKKHRAWRADITLSVGEMYDFDRYGTLDIASDGRIMAFLEKKFCQQGYINGGVYCLSTLMQLNLPNGSFSFEKDFMEKSVRKYSMYALVSHGYFVDIGVPEDYGKACRYFLKNICTV